MNETIEDILREMRDADGVDSSGWFTRKHVLDWANRIEAAAKRQKMLCHSAGSCDLLFQANFEADKLKTENAKLDAALKPVLDIVMDNATSDLAMAEAIDEAHRIYNEGASK